MLFRRDVRVSRSRPSVTRDNGRGDILPPKMTSKKPATFTDLSSAVTSGVDQKGIKGS